MSIFNQYSYVFFAAGIIAVLVTILRVRRVKWSDALGAGGLLAVVLALVFFVLRPASVSDSADAAEQQIGNGKPTLIEFYSNYCAACMAARPAVDSLVATIEDKFNVLRVDIHSTDGRILRERYGFTFSPEFVLFDPQGVEIWRANVLPSENELERAAASSHLSSPIVHAKFN